MHRIRGDFTINLYLSLREIELMKKLDHPHVIKLYEVFRGEGDLYLVMELCTVGMSACACAHARAHIVDNRISSLPPLLSEGKYRLFLLFVGLVLTFLACGHYGECTPLRN